MFELWRERPLLQGVCLSLRKRRSQEKRKRGGKVAVARAVDDAHHFTLHFYYKY